MSGRVTRALCAAAMVVAVASQVQAEGPEQAVQRLERELAVLRAAVEELRAAGPAEARLEEIERRLGLLAEEIEDLKVGEAALAPDLSARVSGLGPAASKVYQRDSGVSIGGYGELLLTSPRGTRDDGTPSGAIDRFDLLRAVLYIGYKFDERFVFNSEIEVEHGSTGKGGEVSAEFAYLDWLYRPGLSLRGGLVLLPMGLVNEMHEPTTFLGALRPEVEQRIIPSTWRENGLGAFGDVGGFSYRSYLVTGLDGAGFSANGLRGGRQKGALAKAESWAWTGRLDWAETPGLLVGLSAYVGDSGQDLLAADGTGLGVRTTIWDVHADWRWQGLRLRALWTSAGLDDVAELNRALGLEGSASVGSRLEGGYLELGYDVLARRGGRSSLVPFARWETADTQVRVPSGFARSGATDVEVLTLGLHFQPIEQLVLKLDWQDVDNAAGTGVDRVNALLGYIF